MLRSLSGTQVTIIDKGLLPESCSSPNHLQQDFTFVSRYNRGISRASTCESKETIDLVHIISLGPLSFLLMCTKIRKSRSYGGLMEEDVTHHYGVLEGWFSQHWWNTRAVRAILLYYYIN
ncbi:hypothetical protein HID58_002962 [Brassica napus]|uniref:Uncharacterized protein n=1 Tax=Brassica napus TaxID=3708 RepID=A0ABQ8ENQ9_BRANA|nr:hypothetical protein HID58_002962 [Brassica napus]